MPANSSQTQLFDSRSFATPIYQALFALRSPYGKEMKQLDKEGKKYKEYLTHLKEQKNQAVELYTYISTWGLLRLKAEEKALNKDNKLSPSERQKKSLHDIAKISQSGKLETVEAFFLCLDRISQGKNEDEKAVFSSSKGLEELMKLDTEEYLGLTGLSLVIAQEFSFWANAVYHDISGEDN
jgi:hypothetical protein